jgi:hypothetical protein
MNGFQTWDVEDLVHQLQLQDWGEPVRLMEAIVARGEAAVAPLVDAVEAAGDGDEDTDPRFWPVVVLGELRSLAAVTALAGVIRTAQAGDIAISFAAAEGLAKLGAGALRSLRSLAGSTERHHRLWAYYAGGRIDDDAVFRWLVEALEMDPEMADVVALALSDQGRPDAIAPIERALARVEPSLRPELEDALVKLHGLDPIRNEGPGDWRLRYRWHPGLGFFPLNWATIDAILEDHGKPGVRPRSVPELRSLEEILAEARAEEPDRCECCDVPTWQGTGVPVCPATAGSVAELQARMLEDIAEEASLDDLFDVLDELDDRLATLESDTGRATPAARRRREDRKTRLRILHSACNWLIERGVESVGRGVARLHADARLAAEEHGVPLPPPREPRLSEPDSFLAPLAPVTREPRVGRNEPCPCGSGKKYKKCHGAGG